MKVCELVVLVSLKPPHASKVEEKSSLLILITTLRTMYLRKEEEAKQGGQTGERY